MHETVRAPVGRRLDGHCPVAVQVKNEGLSFGTHLKRLGINPEFRLFGFRFYRFRFYRRRLAGQGSKECNHRRKCYVSIFKHLS